MTFRSRQSEPELLGKSQEGIKVILRQVFRTEHQCIVNVAQGTIAATVAVKPTRTFDPRVDKAASLGCTI